MRLRSHLTVLTLMTLVPVGAFAVVVGYFLIEQQRTTVIRAAQERALAMLTAVDANLKGALTTLEALAVVPSLREPDLPYFRLAASSVLKTQEDWININLALPDRRRIFDLLAREDAALPPITDDGEIAELLRTRRPALSAIALGPVSKRWNFAARVPVVHDGEVKYILSAVIQPDSIGRLVESQNLPSGWVAAVLDHTGRIVARTIEPETSLGRMASQPVQEALARAPSGWFRTATREGSDVYTAYHRSAETGWAFVMGLPLSAVDAAAWRGAGSLGAGLLAAAALAFWLAHLFGKRIAAPIATLAAATTAVGRGERVALPRTAAIDELKAFADTLQVSIDRLGERTRELQTLLDTAPVQIWLADAECKRIIGNRVAYEHHRLPHGVNASFEGQPVELPQGVKLLAGGRELAPHEMPMQVAARTGKPVLDFEHDVLFPNGERVTMWANVAPVKDETGKVRSVVGVYLDVTQRKRAEEALKEADRAKDEFLAMLGHELRNPLAALTTAAHVLRATEPNSAPAAEARAIVERQAGHMARLVEDLLDVSRITMGKMTLARETFDLWALVSGVLQGWRSSGRLEAHRVSVEGMSAWVHADRARIEQVVANLLDNAVKFNSAGGSIRVSVGEEKGEAFLRVADTGRGIALDALPRIFDAFAQEGRPSQSSTGGLGLGLALVKRLTELHGGSVAVESAGPGSGASFTVRLPATAAPREEMAAPPPAARPGRPRRILVIEDNADARAMLRATLALGGHEVSEASSGEAGLAAAARAQPDVALIDIGLPDMDGYEVARQMRSGRNGVHVALVALTGYGQAQDQQRARDAGFDVHLTKPVASERLEQVLAALP